MISLITPFGHENTTFSLLDRLDFFEEDLRGWGIFGEILMLVGKRLTSAEIKNKMIYKRL